MKGNQWRKIKTIVDRAMTLSGREKESYLNSACHDSPDLYNEVQELLQSIEESEKVNFLEPLSRGYQEIIADMSDNTENKYAGTTVTGQEFGAYRIMECIGEGGMGTVYKAERMDGEFHHTVAVKLIKQGLDSKENIRRFKMEREILAGLNHPNIAQLYDGGINSEGIPYLVMEFVDGIPIDQYCNEHRLTIDERLALFSHVCSAIQYAHNNLVIHRDLKNQNVFVNRNGVVKILDFGVAKLLNSPLDGTPLIETQPNERFWTPQYAAPEQVEGAAITTKTDIYTLGVLLYKLLTDVYPLDLEEKNLVEIGRAIREKTAVPPSRKIKQSELKRCAYQRRATSQELLKTLSGDLDELTLKALRKEPNYRYHSVGQLLDDLDNYHEKKPLVARNDTIRYRAGKFFRRHKMGISVAVTFLVLILGFAAIYSYQVTAERTQAQLEAAKAQQVTNFLMQLFDSNNPNYALGQEITAKDLLQMGAKEIDSMHNQPDLQAAMMSTIGNLYKQMGIYDQSQNFLEQALDLRVELYGTSELSVVEAMNDLGLLFLETGDLEKANELISEAYRLDQEQKRSPDIRTASYVNDLGIISLQEGEYNQAEEYFLKAQAILSGLKTPDTQAMKTTILNNLGFLAEREGSFEEALDFYLHSQDLKKDLYGEGHEKAAIGFNNLGRLYSQTGKLDSAEVYHRKSLELRETLYGEEHQYIAQSLNNFGLVLMRQKKYTEAEKFFERSLDMYRKIFGDYNRNVGLVYGNLGMLYYYSNKEPDVAEKYLKEGIKIYQEILGPQHPLLFQKHKNLAEFFKKQHKFDEAVLEFQKALNVHRKHFPEKAEEFSSLESEFQDLQLQAKEMAF